MLAEIYGKISSEGSNLSERLEDQLTGNVFGTLRYMPFHKAMKRILRNTAFFSKSAQQTFLHALQMQKAEYVGDAVKFWQKGENSEIDVLLALEYAVIGIEVKYHSGLSSNDQLEREALDLLRDPNSVPKYVILLGVEPDVNVIAKQWDRRLPSGVALGYLSWQEVLCELVRMQEEEAWNEFEACMLNDLQALLRRKGLERFRNFDSLGEPQVVEGAYFHFHEDMRFFHFDNPSIQKEEYYEF